MLSKACEYAIRAMLYIVTQTRDEVKVGIKEISKHTDAPEPFVAKILQSLVKRGLVSSLKGPNGGFYLEPGAEGMPLIEIVKAIDGNELFVTCGLGIKNCSEKKPCPIHYQFAKIRDEIKEMLKSNTIQDLAEGLIEGDTFLVKR